MFRDIGAEALGEYVSHDLDAVDRRNRDHLHVAFLGCVNHVAESVFHAFRHGVCAVNDEHALRCTQFAQNWRERAAQGGLKLDCQFGDMAQVDAHRLQAVRVGDAHSGYAEDRECALAYTRLSACDDRQGVPRSCNQLRD